MKFGQPAVLPFSVGTSLDLPRSVVLKRKILSDQFNFNGFPLEMKKKKQLETRFVGRTENDAREKLPDGMTFDKIFLLFCGEGRGTERDAHRPKAIGFIAIEFFCS